MIKEVYRKEYMERLIGLKNTPDIKIITGIRRSGKSKLMKMYIDYLLENEKNANVIYIPKGRKPFKSLA